METMQYFVVLASRLKESKSDLGSVVSGVDNISFTAFSGRGELLAYNNSVSNDGDETVDVDTKITVCKRVRIARRGNKLTF